MSKLHVFSGLRHAFQYRSEPESMRRLADAYWRILILIVLGAAVLAILYGLSQWTTVIAIAQTQSGAATERKLPLDREQLEAVLSALHERQAMSGGLHSAITDPAAAK